LEYTKTYGHKKTPNHNVKRGLCKRGRVLRYAILRNYSVVSFYSYDCTNV